MDGVLGFFGRVFKTLAGIFAILILVAGFFIGGFAGGRGFSFGFALLGLIGSFVFDVMTFGLLGIIAGISDDVGDIIERLGDISYGLNSIASSSSKASTQPSLEIRTNSEGVQFWVCKKCGCSKNPMGNDACKDCGEYR